MTTTVNSEPRVLRLYRRLSALPLGAWLFSRAVCRQAPYFATIAPRIERLEPGRCEATIADRRRVHNHLGTVHAIALCNLAELTAGLVTDVSIPASMRWIPKGMTVAYTKKAVGRMRAVAQPAFAPQSADTGYELPVEVEVTDESGDATLRATVSMYVSPRKR